MSSLAWQRSQSSSKRNQDGPVLSTGSFREKLQRQLRALDLPGLEHTRIAALILADPVGAKEEIKGWKRAKVQ